MSPDEPRERGYDPVFVQGMERIVGPTLWELTQEVHIKDEDLAFILSHVEEPCRIAVGCMGIRNDLIEPDTDVGNIFPDCGDKPYQRIPKKFVVVDCHADNPTVNGSVTTFRSLFDDYWV